MLQCYKKLQIAMVSPNNFPNKKIYKITTKDAKYLFIIFVAPSICVKHTGKMEGYLKTHQNDMKYSLFNFSLK